MERDLFMDYVRQSIKQNKQVNILFDQPTRVLAYKKMLSERNEIAVRFFESDQSTEDEIQYGYKLRITDRTGYAVDVFPISHVKSVEIDTQTSSDKHAIAKKAFIHYWETKVDSDVWKTVYRSIDSVLDSKTAADINKRLCITSRAGKTIAHEIEVAFKERKNTNIIVNDTTFFEGRNGEDGYRAWFVTRQATWMVINPKVAVLPRKSV